MAETGPYVRLPSLFVSALREINREVSDFKLAGRRRYYNLHDAKAIWKLQFGQCYDCGIPLNARGNAKDSGKFVHRVPIKTGGRIHKDNLILVCPRHKIDRLSKRIPSNMFVIGYNAFSDLIVQLVMATLNNDIEKIRFFKQSLDKSLKDIVDSLHYNPVGLEELKESSKYSISAHIQELTKELAKELNIIGHSKSYQYPR